MRIAITLLALALATTGCKKKKTEPVPEQGSGSAMAGSGSDMGSGSAMAGSGSAMAGSGSDMGSGSATMAGSGAGSAETMSHHGSMCPSMVAGSETKVTAKGKDVTVTVTSKKKEAVAEIQKRTDALLAEKADNQMGSAHDQKGTHGGATGICPVYVPEGATAKAKKEKDGSAVTITPKEKPEDLKKEIEARIPKAADYLKANPDVGGGGAAAGSAAGEGSGSAKKGAGKKEGGGGGKGTGGGGSKGAGGGSGSAK